MNKEEFKKELTSLINRYSMEIVSNTPDFILADYLVGCLDNFNINANAREMYYGRENSIMTSKHEFHNTIF